MNLSAETLSFQTLFDHNAFSVMRYPRTWNCMMPPSEKPSAA